MFSKRKSSTDHLPGLEEPILRQHGVPRPPSPRRSSFHGSEPQLHDDHHRHFNQDRKKKYATAPITHHHSASAAAGSQREKPATPTKNKNLPQAPYQKTFIAMLKGKESRASKRRSQEFVECPSPLAQPVLPPKGTAATIKAPSLPPKPSTGTFYQSMPANAPSVASRVFHAGLNHHHEQLYHAEPLPPVKQEFARLSPGRQL